jgi:CRP/FNR family transcriptional regulator, cyclic AMP receptor protein
MTGAQLKRETNLEERLVKGEIMDCRERGFEVYAEGKPADRFFEVITGLVSSEVVTDRTKGYHVWGPGEYFGEQSLGQSPGGWADTVITLTQRTFIMSWPSASIRTQCLTEPMLATNLMDLLLKKLEHRDFIIALLRTRPTARRVGLLLLDLAERMGTHGETGEVSIPRLDQEVIARLAGVTREMANKVMSKGLKESGGLMYERKRAGDLIIRVSALKEYCAKSTAAESSGE